MAEMAVLVAVVGAWAAVRLLRCGSCGIPSGLFGALYAVITFDEDCWGCRKLDAHAEEARPSSLLASGGEIVRRHDMVRGQIAALVERQRAELREAQAAVANAMGAGG